MTNLLTGVTKAPRRRLPYYFKGFKIKGFKIKGLKKIVRKVGLISKRGL
jgi:hypothetical protein